MVTALEAIPQQEFQKVFNSGHRWTKCRAAQGAYFEGDPSQHAVSIQACLQ